LNEDQNMTDRHNKTAVALLAVAWACAATPAMGEAAISREAFADPPLELKSRPLWFWNKTGATGEEIREIMAACRDRSGYYGFGILPCVEREQYLREPYFERYGAALEQARALGLKMCLYDEYWFPSGSAGGQFPQRFAHLLLKRLDMLKRDVDGPAQVDLEAPAGTLMAAAAMNLQSFQRLDLTPRVRDGRLAWAVPQGRWRVMIFTCTSEEKIMNYLDREATEKFLQITHEEYYKRFAPHFGTTIDSVFYDEPTLYRNHGRAWTEHFDERFQARYGRSCATLYPALWMDIGPETASARAAIFGLRAELFATEYIKTMDDWCRAHKVLLTGHMDQEQVVNATSVSGDLMKVFQHQAIPGLDEVFAFRRTQRAYKIVSSSACNWDKPLVMCETYGGIGNMPVDMLYRMGMDLYAKGVNFMVPHAVWTNHRKITFQPELSWRTEPYASALPEYNRWIARLNLLLQGGAHVADLAVVYPIAALHAGTVFDVGKPYDGGPVVPEADYMDVGERLSLEVRRDFTYLHPDVLEERCRVRDRRLCLDNKLHAQQYRGVILPGGLTLRAAGMRRLREFYDAGGTVIATTQLPVHAAEGVELDAQLAADVRAVFGKSASLPRRAQAAASSVFGPGYEADKGADGLDATRWNSSDKQAGEQWLEVTLPEATEVGRVVIREPFDRTTDHSVQVWDEQGGKWTTLARGQAIGSQKSHAFAPVRGRRFRLVIHKYRTNCVTISEFVPLPPSPAGQDAGDDGDRAGVQPVNTNAAGGKAFFLPEPSADALRQALDYAVKGQSPQPYDVTFPDGPTVRDGNLTYIHVRKGGREIYFFANSSQQAVDTSVRLRGKLALETWDPHTGRIAPCPSEPGKNAADSPPTTTFRLRLPAARSVFVVAARGDSSLREPG